MLKPLYRRRLSTTEVEEGFILILKDKVKLFPDVGKPFNLRFKGKDFRTRVKAIDCTCQGPDEPHVHWRLDAKEFTGLLKTPRPEVTIKKLADDEYEMEEL
jgi:hypothetical protein